jgi:hypothetical protein
MSHHAGQVRQTPFDLTFRFCKDVADLQDVQRIAHFLVEAGLSPLAAEDRGNAEAKLAADRALSVNFRDYSAPGHEFGNMSRSSGFPIAVKGYLAEQIWCAFSWSSFASGENKLTIVAIASEPAPESTVGERMASSLAALAQDLYDVARPVYGALANSDVDPAPPGADDVAGKRLSLHWMDFLGPEYVALYGEHVLASIPGWRAERLADGGLLYRSRPSVIPDDAAASAALHERAFEYLRAQHIPTWRHMWG